MTVGICRLCYAAGAIEPSAAHVFRCPDHAACAERADLIAGDEWTPPDSLAPDDLVRLQRKLANRWVEQNMGLIGGVIVEHYQQGAVDQLSRIIAPHLPLPPTTEIKDATDAG